MISLYNRPLVTHTIATALLVLLCAATGLIVTISPTMGAGFVLASAIGALFFFGLSPTRVFLQALVVLLLLYMFLERGVASMGVAPIYIGEMVLALATLQIFTVLMKVRLTTVHWLLLGFMLYGLIRTVPFYGAYGVDALRDAVLWGYAIFAFAVSFTLERRHFVWIHQTLQKWLPWMIALGAIAYFLQIQTAIQLPKPPGSDLPILYIRAGEMAVHLSGMAAFLVLGLYAVDPSRTRSRNETFLYVFVVLGIVMIAAISRGAFVTIGVSLFVAFLFRPSVRLFQIAAIGALLLPILFLLQPSINFGTRQFSAKQITENVTSIFSPQSGTELAGTRSFREDWWKSIISYTFHGPYFWGGKGFGVNLANSDGFQVLEDGSLRSPHNAHMNILARMGVPGFALWLTLLGTFVITMVRARRIFLGRGDTLLAEMAAWILVYWLASCTNALFDVYLEGPEGGIWFWTMMGAGIALSMLAESDREPAPAVQSSTFDWRDPVPRLQAMR
jgi:O-antigen ligase